MSRRRAARRARNIGAATLLLGTMSVLTAPEKVEGTTRNVRSLSMIKPASLQIHQSFFRPAGEVLSRPRLASIRELPFLAESRAREERESLTRWHRVYTFAGRYRIRPELAGKIYDASKDAGIDPELGFRLVQVESEFNVRATSPVGALGLMQLMPGTARDMEPGLTTEQIYNPDTNLRLGFKYLRGLISEYGNPKIALLVYNRGPVAVRAAMSMGVDPTNGYENVVMRGYRGKVLLE